MILNYFTPSITAKIFLLAVIIVPVCLRAQAIQFDLLQGKNKIENFEVLSYKNSEAKVLKSKAGKITIDKSLILQADSIFISHSFYKNVLDLNRVKGATYYIEEAMELESIVLKSPETFVRKDKGRKVDGLCSFCRQTISIPTENLKNKTIKGIELHFPKGKYHSDVGGRRVESKNKNIELTISLTNQNDTLYPNQSLRSIKDTLQVKKNGWNYYDLRHYDLDVENAEHIFISILALDDMVLGRRLIRRKDKDKVVLYYIRKDKKNDLFYFIDSRLIYPDGERISLAYKIHYYD
ncbi:MAG: hypothetical protein ACI9WL_001447 [Rubritalea sp.]|jgi:hypothetical protein